jgi:acyl carrier protein
MSQMWTYRRAAEGDIVETLEGIKLIIAQVLAIPIERLRDDMTLEELGAASIDIVEIAYEIEEKFDISIPIKPSERSLQVNAETEALESMELAFKTIAEFARMVNSLLEAKSGW